MFLVRVVRQDAPIELDLVAAADRTIEYRYAWPSSPAISYDASGFRDLVQARYLAYYSSFVGCLAQLELCSGHPGVSSQKWLEFEGGVISGLFNQPGPALERRRRSRHDDG